MPNQMTKRSFLVNTILPTRSSSFLDPVLSETLDNGDTNLNNRFQLDREQSRLLRQFLVERGTFTLSEPRSSSGDLSTAETTLSLYKASSLNAFVEELFSTAIAASSEVRKLISWVEVVDVTLKYLKSEEYPRRFNFVLHRDMVIRRSSRKDGKVIHRYETRKQSRLDFQHSFYGKEQRPFLNMRTDYASYKSDPTVRYSLDSGPYITDAEDQLYETVNFLIFPLKELHRTLSGFPRAHRWCSEDDGYSEPVEVDISENTAYPVDESFPYPVFRSSGFVVDRKTAYAPYASNLRIDAITFTFQVTPLPSALRQLVDSCNLPKSADKDRVRELTRNLCTAAVPLQSALFSAHKYYNDSSRASIAGVKVETGTKEIVTAWKEHREGRDELLRSMANSPDNQVVNSSTLKIFRPVHEHGLYTISFRTFDVEAIGRQFDKYGEYEHSRILNAKDGVRELPSQDKLLSRLSRSIEVSVTLHSRVLNHDLGIRTIDDFRRKVIDLHDRKVDRFASRVIQQALVRSGVYYWNSPSSWCRPLSYGRSQFRDSIRAFTREPSKIKHWESLSEERLVFLRTLPALIGSGDPSLLKPLHALFKTQRLPRGRRHRSTARIRAVPEFAVAAYIYWYILDTESLWDILTKTPLLPDDWKTLLSNPYRSTTDPRTKLLNSFIRDVLKFAIQNFGVDITYSYQLHAEALRKTVEVLTSTRKRGEHSDFRPESPLSIPALGTMPIARLAGLFLQDSEGLSPLSYTGLIFRDLQRVFALEPPATPPEKTT